MLDQSERGVQKHGVISTRHGVISPVTIRVNPWGIWVDPVRWQKYTQNASLYFHSCDSSANESWRMPELQATGKITFSLVRQFCKWGVLNVRNASDTHCLFSLVRQFCKPYVTTTSKRRQCGSVPHFTPSLSALLLIRL